MPDLVLDASALSRTPNSLNDDSGRVGEGSVDPATRPLTLRLARRSMPAFLMIGEPPTADVRLEMRGILVGVSFMLLGREFNSDGGGMSLGSLEVTELTDPIEGEPAIVGSCCPRVRRDGSDCFCIELAVWAVSLDDVAELWGLVGVTGVDNDELDDEDFRLATRCAVAGAIADICMGGRSKGLAFLGSVDDRVCAMINMM